MDLDSVIVTLFLDDKMITVDDSALCVYDHYKEIIEKENLKEKTSEAFTKVLTLALQGQELKIKVIKCLVVPESLNITQEEFTAILLKANERIDLDFRMLMYNNFNKEYFQKLVKDNSHES